MAFSFIALNGKQIKIKKILIFIFILILLGLNFFFILKYYYTLQELKKTRTEIKQQEINEKVLNFTSFFIKKVLKGKICKQPGPRTSPERSKGIIRDAGEKDKS